MAISYLSNINLNNNQLKSFAVDNITGAADPGAGDSVQGRLIYRTSSNVLKFYNGTAWIALDGSIYNWTVKGDTGSQVVASGSTVDFIGSQGISTAVTLDGAVRKNTITIDNTVADMTGTTFTNATITVDRQGRLLTAGIGSAPITSFNIEGNGTNAQAISEGVSIDFVSNTGLTIVTSSINATNKAATINLALPDLPDMTQVWLGTDEFIVLDNTGHGGETQKRKASSEIPLNILGNPTGNLDINNKKITNLLAGTGNLDAVNLQQLNAAVVGSLTIKGGFNANTGAIDGGGNLTTGAARVAIAVGDFYVVTTDGNFFANALTPLTVGDQVICNTGAGAGASVEGDFVIVQSDTDIATATTVGLASFPTAGGLSVVANGAVSLDVQGGLTANTYGDANTVGQFVVDGKGIITGATNIDIAIPSTQVTNFCTAVEACVGSGLNYAANIGDGSATTYSVTHALGTRDVIVQVYDNTTYDTVICDVVRTSTTVVTLSTTTALAANAARVLITVS